MLLLGTRRNLQSLSHSSELAPGRVWLGRRLLGLVRDVEGTCAAPLRKERRELRGDLVGFLSLHKVAAVEGYRPRAVGPLAELVEEAVRVEHHPLPRAV